MEKKVLVWLSWWVDSAVCAYLLQQQWYTVIAWFMKNYADPENPHCHTREDRNSALAVADHLGITTFCIFDFRKEYDETIISYIYEWYKSWYTPNPDVLCNTKIKFKTFLNAALSLGCCAVATWHYARITQSAQWYHLLKWVDTNKDQSYFLSWLDQHQLAHALFPLWWLTKTQVRALAQEINLPNATRKDSQWLCFIGKVPMKEFLKQTLPVQPGPILDTKGNKLWQHDWAWFYTVWQRQWLWLSWWPWFVISKNVTTNTLIVWSKDEQLLYASALEATALHWTAWSAPTLPLRCQAKIRYRQDDQEVNLAQWAKNTMIVTFEQPQRAISSWQTIAFYNNDELIWSGIIKKPLHTT